MDKAVVLTGYMGAGKSSVAAELGRRLGAEVLDTDARIEELEGMSISSIFKQYGEAYFRDKETGLLEKLKEEGFCGILSTGGGMPLRSANREFLRDLGCVFYLKASPAAIARRLSEDDSRPLLAGAKDMAEKEKRIAAMLSEREAAYKDGADIIVDTDELGVKECADFILRKLND